VSFFQGQATTEQYFNDNWDHTPIAYDNVYFEPQAVDEWVRFTDSNAGGRQASLGDNPLYRYRGIVTIQVFVKPNTGAARYLELADFITGMFRSQRVSGVQFEVPRPVKVGDRDGWCQVNVLCPYYRDEE